MVTLTFGSPFLRLLLGARVEQNTFSLFYKFEKSFEGSCNVFPVCYADLFFFKIVCGVCVRGVCVHGCVQLQVLVGARRGCQRLGLGLEVVVCGLTEVGYGN